MCKWLGPLVVTLRLAPVLDAHELHAHQEDHEGDHGENAHVEEELAHRESSVRGIRLPRAGRYSAPAGGASRPLLRSAERRLHVVLALGLLVAVFVARLVE